MTLTAEDFTRGVQVGLRRHVCAVGARRRSHSGREHGSDWLAWLGDHVLGACGELAVAKWLGQPWSGHVNTFHFVSDLGTRTEVRTRRRDDWDLYVHPTRDPMDANYILVVGVPPTFRVVGWMCGLDAARPEWLRDMGHGPSYFVPQDALAPIPEAWKVTA